VTASSGENDIPDFVVALHPVEHIVFEVKVSVIVAVIVTLPLVLYYAWPALRQRGIVTEGNRNVFLVWGGSMIVGILLGSLFGFFYVAPTIISFLVQDSLDAGLIINYRLNAFLWMVLYTTAGIGVVSMIPVSMLLFDRAEVLSYETMHGYWREFVFAVVVGITIFTPAGVLLMLLTAIPIVVAYLFGLFLLWFLTLPRRVRRDGFRGIWPS
jgi:sec-independent protein translocase protein TatC